ncbi:MAG: Flp family type IVb pilin [Brevundimonas sp.]|uniref:Flp family type IVb pilin n=1 Tax=Brevundimonas sp. TaxID=1871086 RepID=UPI00271E5B5B|nr:Flp family type IVb pilin [Brevundimonas sp.]MDO9587788.1 Flp family type IVb pilin [Brevundimonas sp.]MDP3657333.1 Flp family type IVb pilin [Brevundimonas sp.]MDZ4108600.1 Flp family type IVb pilin [Brevundimonas sp.]
MRRFLSRFRRDERGATAIEYGLIIALIFLAMVGALTVFGNTTSGLFNTALDAVRSAMGG